MPLELIIREGDGPERRQLVAKETVILGRREDNDVVLPFSFVSARHGRVFLRGGLVHVEDMGSTNGTLVNGIALEPMIPRLLGPNDLVEIDRLALRARWVEEIRQPEILPTYHEALPSALAAPPAAGPPAAEAPAAALARGAPAGVWEIQAGALPAAPSPVVSVEARAVGSTLAADFAPSRTLARAPRVAGSSRFRWWSIGLQVIGLLAVIGGLTLLIFVLLA
jgi:hypothetical protein